MTTTDGRGTGPQSPSAQVPGANLLSLEKDGPLQMGFWVPNRVWATAHYLVPLRRELAARRSAGTLTPMTPAVQVFKDWVGSHSVHRMWVNAMIDQANAFVLTLDPATQEQIRDQDGDVLWIDGYDSLFELLNEIITTSPGFNTTAMVGTPMNGLLAIAMATEAGTALFHDTTFNEQFRAVLDAWNAFLKSPASLDKLDIADPEKPGSWISQAAWQAGVWDQMVHDSSQPGYGFACWNDFFIREFVPGARPFQGTPAEVDIGCETTPWRYADDLALEDAFWVKDMPYSLVDLFGGREDLAGLFSGGQLYQGFLSATHYHRWNAPLDGQVVRSWVEPGTYFAQRPDQGEDPGTWEGTESQPYLGHVAARAVFLFEHPQCGVVALICIGMVEVSTCVIEPAYLVGEGDDPVPITKGAEIGHFEFGGSTHMMIFQRDRVVLEAWARDAVSHRNDPQPTPLGSLIARPT